MMRSAGRALDLVHSKWEGSNVGTSESQTLHHPYGGDTALDVEFDRERRPQHAPSQLQDSLGLRPLQMWSAPLRHPVPHADPVVGTPFGQCPGGQSKSKGRFMEHGC